MERNLAKAFRLYWQASDNCRPARERLNKDSYQGQLAKWLKKAVNRKDLADADLAEAMCMLGSCYQHGWGVDDDMSSAVEWYRKAVDADGHVSPDALCGLGDCYAGGKGVKQDWEKAVALYRQAAEMDDPEAQYLLARCYDDGHGVETDMKEAVRLYKKAANNVCENKGYYGHVGAMRCLGDCYTTGNGIRKNAKQAAAWYAKATELEAASK